MQITFGQKITELRLEKNWTLRKLAEKSGVSYSLIGSIESGSYKVSRETVISLGNAFHYGQMDELLKLAGYAAGDSI
ncbi:helix-turn-helix domain-containing protein [Paenibacillus eucommiae]|uniref:Transcriptional regulator with XRE-family HTH domain n=1 Tax=Paenibacillus eucommiae TaxID=1355755 RepID=A0ABS4IW70_9BACL|nr:helix-turn-helix transcriptional regulator [Paenibacillus eucommiae]MBP1991838.1 transcriptional regulator with XRE-family HTH domain [Paenibacillus eucommiae]